MKIPITGRQRLNAVTTETSIFKPPWRIAAAMILSCAFAFGAGQTFAADYQVSHTFTIDDLVTMERWVRDQLHTAAGFLAQMPKKPCFFLTKSLGQGLRVLSSHIL